MTNVPEIRVVGVDGVQWSQKKCGDLLTERNVQHPQSEEYPLVSFTIEDGVTPKTERYERESLVAGDKNAKKYKETRLNDIVYNPANLKFGAIARNKYGNAVFSPIYVTFDVNENFAVPEFMEVLVSKKDFIQDALQYQKGTVYERMSVCSTDFLNLDVKIPSVAEQRQIGSIFERLDALISQHYHKYESLVAVKKAMLEKMFPKEGKTIPEIRFAGFTDPWEQRKLSDLIIEYKEAVDSDCTLPVLTSSKTEGVVLQEEHFGRVQNHDITGYNILPRNYCTYRNRSDGVDFTFNINRCCDKGIISKFYPVFYGNNSDIFFISMVLNYCDEVVHEIAYTCTGTGQKVLSFLDLQKMNIRVPSYDEQKKISQYFEQLDNLITLHQRKCEVFKNLKSALLNKMFVGTTE